MKCYRINGKKILALASGLEQRLVRERQALIDTHMKLTTAGVFSSVFAKSYSKNIEHD